MAAMGLRTTAAALLALAFAPAAAAGEAEIEAHRRVSEQVVEATQIDKLLLASAQSKLVGSAAFEKHVDYVLFRLRPPALWDSQHPAWAPARATLLVLARDETTKQVRDYWKSLHPLVMRELAGTFTPPEAEELLAFAQSPGGKAWFERRLAEQRAKNGAALYDLEPEAPAELTRRAQEARKRFETLPAAEKQRVDAFLAGAQCPRCARPPAKVLDNFITGQVDWLAEVLSNQFGSTDWHVVDGWLAGIEAKNHAALPVDSKKQLLGVLEMRRDASLAFRFKYFWKDRADGGTHTLEFPRGHPNYDEVLALAPGLAAGQSRVLYRDERGVMGDQP